MPLYQYECVNCGNKHNVVFGLEEFPDDIRCDACGEIAVKVITPGHGGIRCDSASDIPWFQSAIDNLQPDHERPLETRGEYESYLKDRGIQPAG